MRARGEEGELLVPQVGLGVPVEAHWDEEGPEPVAAAPDEVVPDVQGGQDVDEEKPKVGTYEKMAKNFTFSLT